MITYKRYSHLVIQTNIAYIFMQEDFLYFKQSGFGNGCLEHRTACRCINL